SSGPAYRLRFAPAGRDPVPAALTVLATMPGLSTMPGSCCGLVAVSIYGSICSIARLLYGDMRRQGRGNRAGQADRGRVGGGATAAAVAECKERVLGLLSSKGRRRFLLYE